MSFMQHLNPVTSTVLLTFASVVMLDHERIIVKVAACWLAVRSLMIVLFRLEMCQRATTVWYCSLSGFMIGS